LHDEHITPYVSELELHAEHITPPYV
jgi:hypothetical protein